MSLEEIEKMNELKLIAFEVNQLKQQLIIKKNNLADKLREYNENYLINQNNTFDYFDLLNNWNILAQICQ